MGGQARRRFTVAFKQEAVRFLEETGRPLRDVATELEVSEGSLWRWQRQYGTGGAGPALPPSEAEELRQLRREVAVLRQERDFLKKAAASFAQHPE
jgi:transposase